MKELPKRRLGRTGKAVTALGLGGAALSQGLYGRSFTERDSIETVLKALELGVRYIDTSPLYGDSERRIGLALAESGMARDDFFLATKTGTHQKPHDYSAAATHFCVEQSLSRLKTDYLDLVLIHDAEGPGEFESALAPGNALEVLQGYKAQGVIGAIGLGLRRHDLHLRAIRHGAFEAILTYADFNLVSQTARANLFGEAAQNEVGLIIGSPLLFGYLSERPLEVLVQEHNASDSDTLVQKVKRVREFAAVNGVSHQALNLQYILRDDRVGTILVGAGTAQEIEQNVTALLTPLEAAVWERLGEIAE